MISALAWLGKKNTALSTYEVGKSCKYKMSAIWTGPNETRLIAKVGVRCSVFSSCFRFCGCSHRYSNNPHIRMRLPKHFEPWKLSVKISANELSNYVKPLKLWRGSCHHLQNLNYFQLHGHLTTAASREVNAFCTACCTCCPSKSCAVINSNSSKTKGGGGKVPTCMITLFRK